MPRFLRLSFSTKVTVALSAGLGILLALAAFGFYSAGEFFKTGNEVRRLLQVRAQLQRVRWNMERTESAQLRYQLSANAADLDERKRLSARVIDEIALLRELLIAPEQLGRSEKLKRLVTARFNLMDELGSNPGTGAAAAMPSREARSAENTQAVQDLLDAIGQRQQQQVTQGAERLEDLVKTLSSLASAGSVIAVALLLWTVSVINRYERDRRRAESDLASARERLTFALEGSKSAAWDWNFRRNEVYLSAGWRQLLGAKAEESTVTSAALLDLVHPDDVAQVQRAIRSVLDGSAPDYREEHRVRRVDGAWIWILSQGRVVQRDTLGRPLRITGINHDVSERKAIELALKEHDLQLQLALATAGMVRWDWDVGTDEFIWPEDPWRLAGPAPKGGYLGLQDMVHPEDLVKFIRVLNEAVRTGESYRDDYRITRTDGRIVWVSARGYPVRDAGGKVVRVIGVAQDVSEIKQAEQALRDSERELRLITDSVPAFISYADAGEIVRFCNRALADFVGMQPGELVGKPLREWYSEDVYRALQPYARRALAGERVQFQRQQLSRHGGYVDLDVTYIPRRGRMGEVEGFYALLTDISEMKRLDRMKSEFVSTVSHELRTPLTSIRGSLGILAGGVAGPLSDKVRGFIDIANENCERLIRLINDILDMEKIESGKMSFQMQVLDLMTLIERALGANEGYAAQHGVRLRLVSTRPGVKVNADSDRLAQVLTNLISNACKFSPAQASVDIAVSEAGERVRVEVIDHGPGISEAFQRRIFQKFSQEDSSDMRQKGGTGLGLSISKAIVEGLGGDIGFETETGTGTTFYFHLPLWRDPAAVPSATQGRARMLVYEADAAAGRRLQEMANKAGYDADIAGNAAEARSLLRQSHYVAMALDLDLTDAEAVSLLRELRADPATAGLPVVALCATWDDAKQKVGAAGLRVVDWLSKPIDEARLFADLQSVHTADARPRILHVEDDTDVRNIVATIARDIADFDSAANLAEARALLQREKFDLVLLDLGLPDGSGWDLLPQIDRLEPPVRVVIFSAQDADLRKKSLPYTFLVKSQTSERRLIEVLQEAVKATG